MRPHKVGLLINLALGIGFLFGYHWPGQEAARLRRELEAARRATRPVPGVRGVAAERKFVIITHEEIPGLMGAMTMAFPTTDGKLLRASPRGTGSSSL